MKINPVDHKATRVFLILGFFFLTNALVAEFMGVKIFSVEDTFGISHFVFTLFGEKIDGFSLTCGAILWPFVFILTDIINEYFGKRGVQFLSWIAAGMIAFAFLMLFLAIHVAPAPWWIHNSGFKDLNFNEAYSAVFGQGMTIIIASLSAFLISQLIDVKVFHWIKQRTGEKKIWMRTTGSTLISQLIDSFVVLFLAFYVLQGSTTRWSFQLVLAVSIVNYIYKFLMALLITPVIYLVHAAVEKYLGEEYATHLKEEAMKE